ncbi:MAG TPA: DoxX family protein [Bryobacteraceae bacterium]|nr:DoxX family protein [Bryobacteraceae bacterium]
MEMTSQNPALAGAGTTSRTRMIAYWTVTAIFCALISFTAYAEMRFPDVVQEFTRLGFSAGYFREELSWAKVAGVVVLLAPVPARVKEWAYAGFTINLVSALIAHFAMGDAVAAWIWAAGMLALTAASYLLWNRSK